MNNTHQPRAIDPSHLAALEAAFGARLRIVVLPPNMPEAEREEMLGDCDVTGHAQGDIDVALATSAEIVRDVRGIVAPLRWW